MRNSRRILSQTHEVFNQSNPLKNYNMFSSDPILSSSPFFQSNHLPHLLKYGEVCGSNENSSRANQAEKNKPILKQFDIYGRRVDVVDFHESYHYLMNLGLSNGVSGYGHVTKEKGSHIARAALLYFENQLEPGHCCPLVMTTAAVSPLKKWGREDLAEKLCVFEYDPRNIPIEQKRAITAGMSMTEKQGGSDVRANTTLAQPVDSTKTGSGQAYTLRGHKWFTSAPMCDIFLTLAMTTGAKTPTCFIVPRWIPNGERNTGFKVMRFKDKLGDRANASSEVEYDNAYAEMLGEEGKGVKTIIEMVQSTRLDCIIGSAGGCRRSLTYALNHATQRKSFGSTLVSHPLMENLLADLCVESEAHTLTAMYLAAAYDAGSYDYTLSSSFSNTLFSKLSHQKIGPSGFEAQELFRVGVAVGKYWVTKRSPGFTYECMEVFGGNGYVEDFPMAMLFRHSPLNSIWEGSGNIIALDVLRAHKSFPVLLRDIKQASGCDSGLDNLIHDIEKSIHQISTDFLSEAAQRQARNLTDKLALAMQASILIRFGDEMTAKAYLASRINRTALNSGLNFGSFVYPKEITRHLIERNRVH